METLARSRRDADVVSWTDRPWRSATLPEGQGKISRGGKGGIIGRKRFGYDLWGDTVNLASRMESTGLPGRTQITSVTRDHVAPWFVCERRGVIEVKG